TVPSALLQVGGGCPGCADPEARSRRLRRAASSCCWPYPAGCHPTDQSWLVLRQKRGPLKAPAQLLIRVNQMRLRFRRFLRPGLILVLLALAGLPSTWPTVARAASPPPSLRIHHPLHKAPPPGRTAVPSTASGPSGYIPCDISDAYHLRSLQAAGIRGTGQLIAIVDAFDNPYAAGDLHSFDVGFGLVDPAFNVYNLGAAGGSALGTGWDGEIDLDVEWAHAAAPGAAIALVEVATDQQLSAFLGGVAYAVNSLGADVVSMSWGSQGELTGETAYDANFPATTPTGKPVMYVAAAGDSGFGTSWPAVSPRVLGAGGTSLASSAVGNDTQFTHYDCSGM